MQFIVRALVVTAVATVLAACGGGGGGSAITGGTGGTGGGGGTGGTGTTCSTGTFCMSGSEFFPITATIVRNSAATWVNNSGTDHTVNFDNPPGAVQATGSGPSGNITTISNGQTHSRTFGVAGTYAFHCAIHAGMTAQLTVQ